MQNIRSEVLELLSYCGLFSWEKAMYLMRQHRWTKRQRADVLAHSLACFHTPKLEIVKGSHRTIKKTIASVLSKRKMRPRYLFDDLMIPSHINKNKAKSAVLLGNSNDFAWFITELIKNYNLFNQL